ncbi:MAG: hypothetical protein WCK28_08230, partial [Burkholderiales bacterium]
MAATTIARMLGSSDASIISAHHCAAAARHEHRVEGPPARVPRRREARAQRGELGEHLKRGRLEVVDAERPRQPPR